MPLWIQRRTSFWIFFNHRCSSIPNSGCGNAQLHRGDNLHLTSYAGIACVLIYFYLYEIQYGPKKAFSSDVFPKALWWRLLPTSQAGRPSLHYYSEEDFILLPKPFFPLFHSLSGMYSYGFFLTVINYRRCFFFTLDRKTRLKWTFIE